MLLIPRLTLAAAILVMAAPFASGQDGSMGATTPDSRMQAGTSPGGGGLSSLYAPNLYDGSTNITIPIYNYEAGGGNYGLSFGYNTKGVKVDEVASSVGLHWSLNAGGSIVRVLKDLPDELQVTGDEVLAYDDTYVYNKYTKFKGRYVTYSESTGDAADPQTYRDQESDDFIVSAGGLSFTFNLSGTTSVFTNPERNVKVEVLLDGSPITGISSTQMVGSSSSSLLLEFRITDESGNQYYFQRGDYFFRRIADEYSDNGWVSQYYYTGRWDLSKVVLADGKEIAYRYTAKAISMPDYNYYQFRENSDGTTTGSLSGAPVSRGGNYAQLDTILYPNDVQVQLVYDTEARCDFGNSMVAAGVKATALREVKVVSGGNCIRYALQQAYFVSPYTGSSLTETPYGSCLTINPGPTGADINVRYHRLKLKGITIKSCDGTVEEPYYTFDYESQQLPGRMAGSQDFYGYYNGKEVASTDKDANIPLHVRYGTTTMSGVADKDPDPVYAKAWLLNKVSNAYGGSLNFSYGGHYTTGTTSALTAQFAAGFLPSDNLYLGKGKADGVRLNSITEQDTYHSGNNKTTTFTYSQGQLFLDGGYFHYPTIMADGSTVPLQLAVTGQYISPHHLVNGSNHGYGQVEVKIASGSSQLSRRVLTFTNFKDASNGNQLRYKTSSGSKHFFEFPYTDKQYLKDWEMGLPLSVTEYDENNRIVSATTNYYRFTVEDFPSLANTKKSFVRRNGIWEPSGSAWLAKRFFTDNYSPYRGKTFLDSTVTLKYVSDSEFIGDTVWYSYDSRDNIKNTIVRNSKGDKVYVINYYNYDAGSSTMPGIEQVVATQRWRQAGGTGTVPPSGGTLLDAYFNTYEYTPVGTTGSKDIRAESVYSLRAGAPLTPAAYTGTGSYVSTAQKINGAFAGAVLPNFREASRVLQYDAKGHPQETRLQGQEVYKAMVWDSKTGQVLAEAANCRYADIGYTSFENVWTAAETGGALTMATGNISFTLSRVITSTSLGSTSGKKIYQLVAGGLSAENIFGTQTLPTSKTYYLGFWARGNAPRAYIGSTLLTLEQPYTVGSWKYYQVKFTPSTAGVLSIRPASSGTSYVDQVRLHPADAQMTSRTYEPLYGISSATDATGRISYYEYDKLGRLVLTRNQEGHILGKTQYTVQGPQ